MKYTWLRIGFVSPPETLSELRTCIFLAQATDLLSYRFSGITAIELSDHDIKMFSKKFSERFLLHCLHLTNSPTGPHHASAKPLTDRPKLITTPAQRVEEQIMPLSTLVLGALDRLDRSIAIRTDRTLYTILVILIDTRRNIKTALVEAVFAHEMHDWEIQRRAAGRTPRCGEARGLGVQVVELGCLCQRVRAVRGDESAVGGDLVALTLDCAA